MTRNAEERRLHCAHSGSPALAEIQDIFQRAVLHGDGELMSHILDNTRTTRDVLLGVYRNGYVRRLVEIIRNDHPQLATYLGDAGFEDMARSYIAAHPSRTPNARWVPTALPEFLALTAPYAAYPQIAEMAAIERALADAFDAADAPVIGLSDLAAIPPEDWGRLAFRPHPSVRRIDATTNAAAIWCALKSHVELPSAVTRATPEPLIVWRDGVMPKLRTLRDEEAMIWNEAATGQPFAALCELCAVFDDPAAAPARAAGYLNAWLANGLIMDVTIRHPGRINSFLGPI
jgi:hypothetical protein